METTYENQINEMLIQEEKNRYELYNEYQTQMESDFSEDVRWYEDNVKG